MTRSSHLVEAFLSSAWYLHGPIYDRLANLLQAHLLGRKAEWRAGEGLALAMEDDEPEAAPYDERSADWVEDGIAVIDVRGMLAMHADQVNGACLPRGRSYDQIISQVQAAAADSNVRTIVLRLETPGGHAWGCQEAFDAIRAADAVKPVHAFLTGYCFSAGMYLASGCRSITAVSKTMEMGSIGTVWATWDDSAAAAADGLKRIVVRAGSYKALIQDGEPVSDAAIAEEQRIVNAYGAAFHDAVRLGRGLSDAQAEAVLNGRCWLAGDAVSLGLCDAIATFPDFLASLAGTPEPAMFGMKKTPAAPAAPVVTPAPSTPSAAEVAKESVMDKDTQTALAALSLEHPTMAVDLITAATAPGATSATLAALVAKRQDEAKAQAVTAKITALESQVADLTAKLDAANVAATASAVEIARLQKIAGLAQDAPPDVGGGVAPKPNRAAMNDQQKDAYVAKYGREAYLALPL